MPRGERNTKRPSVKSGRGRHRSRVPSRSALPSETGPIHVNGSQVQHRQNFIARLVNQWFDRVIGAMKSEGGLSEAEAAYDAHQTTRDFVWNSVGNAVWAIVFPVMTMVSTQLVGVEVAGMISMAYIVGLLLMFVGNFGVRTFQVSDTKMQHSFKDYQANRWVTCAVMLLIGWLYCSIRGYSSEMFGISMGIIIYKFVDALADVYEGRLQQVDKLYLAGISQTLRSVAALAAFIILLFLTRNGVVASYATAIAAVATFVIVTWPLTLMEAPASLPFKFSSFIDLFKSCAPLFIAIFMFNVIENMPKFFMEGSLPYDAQLYFNAIFFPAQMILILSQLVYKPLLLRMAGVWQDASKRVKFNLLLVGILAVITVLTLIMCGIMGWFGISLLGVLYGIDFHQFHGLVYLMLLTGGITAAIDFLYQVITIMRRQRDVTTLYLVAFVFSIFVPWMLVHYAGFEGAVLSYVIIEAILFMLLVWEYFRIRRDLAHGTGRFAPVLPEADVQHYQEQPLLDPAEAFVDDDPILEDVPELENRSHTRINRDARHSNRDVHQSNQQQRH